MKLKRNIKIFWAMFSLTLVLFGFQNCEAIKKEQRPPSLSHQNK